MRYAPLRSRIFLFVFFAGIGTSSLAMSALVTAMPVGARAAFCAAGAALVALGCRALLLSVVLSPSGVLVRAMLFTKFFPWSDVNRFASISISSGFGELASPFLVLGRNDREVTELVVLAVARPLALPLESREHHWSSVVGRFELYRRENTSAD